jgi:hypothetical protein
MAYFNGPVMRKIAEYLDSKADRFPPKSILDIRAYATIAEISSAIGAKPNSVWNAIQRLMFSGKIRIYENGQKRKKKYGSHRLPPVHVEDLRTLILGQRIRHESQIVN